MAQCDSDGASPSRNHARPVSRKARARWAKTQRKRHAPGSTNGPPFALSGCSALEDREKRERLRLPSGGLVWITADGSPLTDALAAALKRRDLRCQVVRLNQEPIPQPDDSLCGLIILAPREPHGPTFVQDAFRALRAAGPALQQSASRGSAVFVTVSRLDGSFGLTGLASESSPAAGALAGLAKTARHEWQGVDCKALDLDCSIESAEEAALAIVDEIICRGPAEVGLKSGNDRVSVEIEPVSSYSSHSSVHNSRCVLLGRNDLVVISGGARGSLPKSLSPWPVRSGRDWFCSAERRPRPPSQTGWRIFATRPSSSAPCWHRSNRRPTPSSSAKRRAEFSPSAKSAATSLVSKRPAHTWIYRSVDVRDGAAVSAVIEEIQAKYGKIRGLIHGAGIVADRKITDQTDAQFEAWFTTPRSSASSIYSKRSILSRSHF